MPRGSSARRRTRCADAAAATAGFLAAGAGAAGGSLSLSDSSEEELAALRLPSGLGATAGWLATGLAAGAALAATALSAGLTGSSLSLSDSSLLLSAFFTGAALAAAGFTATAGLAAGLAAGFAAGFATGASSESLSSSELDTGAALAAGLVAGLAAGFGAACGCERGGNEQPAAPTAHALCTATRRDAPSQPAPSPTQRTSCRRWRRAEAAPSSWRAPAQAQKGAEHCVRMGHSLPLLARSDHSPSSRYTAQRRAEWRRAAWRGPTAACRAMAAPLALRNAVAPPPLAPAGTHRLGCSLAHRERPSTNVHALGEGSQMEGGPRHFAFQPLPRASETCSRACSSVRIERF